MATRRDFIMISEVLRTTPMEASMREALAEHFASKLAEAIPGFEPDKFVHESTRGTRAGDEAPTVTLPALVFDPALLRADWEQTEFTEQEEAMLAGVPDEAILSALREAFDKHSEAMEDLRENVHDDATDAVFRKVRKWFMRGGK